MQPEPQAGKAHETYEHVPGRRHRSSIAIATTGDMSERWARASASVGQGIMRALPQIRLDT